MTWERMAHRLSKGEDDKSTLINKEKIQLLLESQLSTITKAYEGQKTINLNYIWPQVLDHIYVIMRLISPKLQTSE